MPSISNSDVLATSKQPVTLQRFSTSQIVATSKMPVTPQDILPLPKTAPRKDAQKRPEESESRQLF